MARSSPLAALGFVSALATPGCEDPVSLPELTYETERTRVGTDFDEPLCGADLLRLDQQVEQIERATGTRHEDLLEVYLFADPDAVPCARSPFGCYLRDQRAIVSIWEFVDHELVHGVTHSVDYPSRFWSEGLAESLSLRGTHRDTDYELTSAALNSDSRPNYTAAGHLLRYLSEEYGDDAVMEIIRSGDPAGVTGLDADQLIEQHNEEAPYSYPARDPCPFPSIPETSPGTWSETVKFSCESDEASRFEWSGPSVVRTLQLDEPGLYEVRIAGGLGALIVGCQMAPLDSEPPDFSNGDIMNQAEALQTAFGWFYDSGTPHPLEMTEGTYRFALSSDRDDMTSMDIEVVRLDE